MEPVREQLTDDEVIELLRKLPQRFAEVVMLADLQEFSYIIRRFKRLSVRLGWRLHQKVVDARSHIRRNLQIMFVV